MAFNKSNRSSLLISDDFLFIVYNVLESGRLFEQLLIVTSIWKLIAQNFKGKNVIKNSKLYDKLLKLSDRIAKLDANSIHGAENPNEKEIKLQNEIIDELRSALSCVIKILQT